MTQDYLLAVGEADRLRLEILGELYNPITQYFLIKNGLRKQMTVLEFGCGAGDMACWLAKYVGPKGKVIALDNSQEQIAICREKANAKGIRNIEFYCHDINHIDELNLQVDLIYGRWVLFFLQNCIDVLGKLFSALKPGAIFTYETASDVGSGDFSFPESKVLQQWFANSEQFFKQNNYCVNLGNQLYSLFHNLGLSNIDVIANQPIMKTAREKSVLRLGSMSCVTEVLRFMEKPQYDRFIQDLIAFENSPAIGGFYRNILAAGVKK